MIRVRVMRVMCVATALGISFRVGQASAFGRCRSCVRGLTPSFLARRLGLGCRSHKLCKSSLLCFYTQNYIMQLERMDRDRLCAPVQLKGRQRRHRRWMSRFERFCDAVKARQRGLTS